MRVLSLFSGIGGFDLGLEMAGMEMVAQVEIDPYCRRILEKHWPGVARYEDVRSVGLSADRRHGLPFIRGAESSVEGRDGAGNTDEWASGVDLICGGFPCQDLSVAGKRAGLDGARSGLWFEFQRIVSEVRPRYVLVENVPGLLSSNQGRDFAVVIGGLGDLGYAVSWAVLDSRHFGVAQRRRRVFVVAGPDPESTEAVLALAEGCAGHPETRRAAGEDVANTLGGGSAESSRGYRNDLDNDTYIPEVAHPVNARDWKGVNQREDVMTYVAVRTAQTSVKECDCRCSFCRYDIDSMDYNRHLEADCHIGNGVALEQAVAFDWQAGHGKDESFRGKSRQYIVRKGPYTGALGHTKRDAVMVPETSHTLSADGFDASEDGTGRGTPVVGFTSSGAGWWNEGLPNLRTQSGGTDREMVGLGASVRRLTPLECARLQAFPDDWLDGADGPQYRALGNAVTVSVIQWIGERIMAVERERMMSERSSD